MRFKILFAAALGFAANSWGMDKDLAKQDVSEKTLVIVGDSLTEGYGVSQEQAYPARLQALFKEHKKSWRVINSGISGSTAASAAARVTWALRRKPDLLLLALGANDGLRGTPVKDLESNLAKAIEAAQKEKSHLVLAGMQMPPNYGAAYTKQFKDVYPRLARRYHVQLLPFLLDGVAGRAELNQGDGIHPNAKGHELVAATVYKALEKNL